MVGLARDGRVWMAADSLVSVCDRPMPGSVRKILRLPVGGGGEVLLAIAGDGALAGLARRFLKIGPAPGSGEDQVADFADQIAQDLSALATEHGVLHEGRMDGMLLLGWGGRVWTLVHAQAIPHPDGLAAAGSGGDAALGAMDALLGLGTEPAEAVVRAVQIAIGRDINSGGPVAVEFLQPAPVPAEPDIEESSGRGSGDVVRAAQG